MVNGELLRFIAGAGVVALLAACGDATPAPPERLSVTDEAVSRRYGLIPAPARLAARDGSFPITPTTRLVLSDASDADLGPAADFLASYIRAATGIALPIERGAEGPGTIGAITLRLRSDAAIPAEGYHLDVTPAYVGLTASTPAGIFYGIQTLRQLLPVPGAEASPAIPAVAIADAPRFGYRGMHLDVARHFFPVDFVKKYIDLLATYRMNQFHWHLTDDQGWRIEIGRYPRLTAVGGCRRETRVGHARDEPRLYDGTPHCGFYTRAEIREIVAYARLRHVNVIPEIELPGHAGAALAAYPELGCTPGPGEVHTDWGIGSDLFCPKEETFAFLEGVLSEVMDLFPGPYIHIGGDEAPKTAWEESPIAQAVMRREGLEDEHALQSYFIARIERGIVERGRRMIGWDEIVEGGLSPSATVMYWRDHGDAGLGVRGADPATIAARAGNDLIMTPHQTLYFDAYQGEPAEEPLAIGGLTTLQEVYGYEPIPAEFTPSEAAHVLGAQANVWTEYMKTGDHVEYMVLPRMLALAEVVWSPLEARDWSSFDARASAHLPRLRAMGFNFREPGR